MLLQYFVVVFASLLISINSESLIPSNGQSFYQLQHPDKGKLDFSINFITVSPMVSDKIIKFVAGNEKTCMFSLSLTSRDDEQKKYIIETYPEEGGFNETAQFRLENAQQKLKLSYFENEFKINGQQIKIDCKLEWLLLNENTNIIDVLIINEQTGKPTDINIEWYEYIKYYDFPSNAISEETSTTSSSTTTSTAGTTQLITTTTTTKLPDATTQKEETGSASIGIIVGAGVGGFLLGCIIGGGCAIGYLLWKKKKSQPDVQKEVKPKKSNTKLRRDNLGGKSAMSGATVEQSGYDTM